MIVYKNGRFGFNAEHSWADAPILSYLEEDALSYEFSHLSRDEDGRISGTPTIRAIPPERLKWSIPDEVN